MGERIYANRAARDGGTAIGRDISLPSADGDVTLTIRPVAAAERQTSVAPKVSTPAATGSAAQPSAPSSPDDRTAVPPPPMRSRRFTFAMDADGRVTEIGPALQQAVGAFGAVGGRHWSDLARDLEIDPEGVISRMIDAHDTWSGVVVGWPREASDRVPVRLAALPRFGEGREFLGYRGFGEVLEQKSAEAEDPAPETEADEGDEPAVDTEDAGSSDDEASEAAAAEAAPEGSSVPDDGEPAIDAGAASAVGGDEQAGSAEDAVSDSVEPAPSAPEPEGPDPVEEREVGDLQNVHRLHPDRAPPVQDNSLNDRERSAFHAIAHALGARLPFGQQADAAEEHEEDTAEAPVEDAGQVSPEPVQSDAASDESGRRMRDMLARIPLGMAVSRDDNILYANRALLDTFGFTDLDDLEIAGGFDAVMGGAASEESDGAVRGRHRNGSPLELETHLSRINWDGAPAMLLSVQRLEPVAALGTELAALRQVVELATDGTLVLDREGTIVSANDAAVKLLGSEGQALAGRSLLSLVSGEHQAIADRHLKALAGGDTANSDTGFELLFDVNGTPVPALATGAPMAAGDSGGLCIVLRDLRRWKTVEAEAMTARNRAEQANEKKSDFLAKMSHEIRTPLNAIIGFAEVMLEERFGPVGSERYREYLSDIRESGEHIMSLVNDLLDLSKVEAGKMDLSFTGVRLNDLVEQTVAIMQPQANRQRVIIRTSLSGAVPTVVADSRSLRQVMMNLLSNGIKFTPAGGQVIVSTALTDEGDVALRVRDTGVGMSAEETEIALEPFRQVGGRSESSVKGSGLGLPLTKALAEANRARFAIRSRPGDGTIVEITFPRSRVLDQ